MPLSSYYKIKYAILKQLFDDMEAGKRTSREMISPERFKINESYWLDIISSLSNNGHVSGLTIVNTKSERALTGLDDIRITEQGIDYLHDNSHMRKAYEFFKDAVDIFLFPLIK